jgi:predicted TIM-barrel fold metal-dependent hydrolase
MPREPFDHYLEHRLFYDCAGWSGPDYAAEWVRAGLAELPSSQVVFATDYPQAVRHDDEVVAYVKAMGALGSGARKVLNGTNAKKLIPNLMGGLTA